MGTDVAEILGPGDRMGAVCDAERCMIGAVAIIGEAGDVVVCVDHAADIVQVLLTEPAVRKALRERIGQTVIVLDE